MKIIVMIMVCFSIALFAQDEGDNSAPVEKKYTEKEARDEVMKALREKRIDSMDIGKYLDRIKVGKIPEVMKELEKTKESIDASMDWPHFLGPNYNMTSNEKGLLREWPAAAGPKVLWRNKISESWSCPSIAGNDLALASTHFNFNGWSNTGVADKELIELYDAVTGKKKWEYNYPTYAAYATSDVGWALGGVRASPAITDKYVFSVDMRAHVVCLDRKKGALVWEKVLYPEFYFKQGLENKGYNNSPIIIDDVLVLFGATGNAGKHYNWAMGLDPATGKQLWLNEDKDREPNVKYVDPGFTAIPITLNKELCALAVYNGYLRAYRAKDGKEILKFNMFPDQAHMTGCIPLLVGNKVVSLPWCNLMTCAEIDLKNPSMPGRIVWRCPDHYMDGDIHNFLHYNGYIYGFNGNAQPSYWMECINLKDGKIAWKTGKEFRKAYSYTATADGLMFLRSMKTLYLVELNPEKFTVKSKIENMHEYEWTEGKYTSILGLSEFVMPVLSRGRLYIRNPVELICYDVAKH